MKSIIAFFIFCLVLFMYLHINFHLKTSDELELYEIDDVSKERFEEICDLRQPVLFDFNNEKIMNIVKASTLQTQYPSFEVKVRETPSKQRSNDVNFLQLPFRKAVKLFKSDKESAYFSENNSDFLQETTFVKNMSYNDSFLRPFMVSNCNYDILFGSNKTQTPFRYELNYRTFFVLTEGEAKIKIAPPCSTKYLHTEYDYENFEFRSPIQVWNPQEQYKPDFSKIKCLEFTMQKNKALYLPAYWWYSFELQENAFISCFRYRTYMSTLSIAPYIAMYALQNQNVKREFTKKASVETLGKSETINEERKEEDLTNNIV
jgi:hypothetical protein